MPRLTPQLRIGLVVALVAALAMFPLVNPPRYLVTVFTEVMIFAIFAMSLDLLLGYTGLASLGHAAFFGIGAYTAGIAAKSLSASVLAAVPLGVLAAGLGALLIGALCIRTSGVYFLMLTLAFGQMVFAIAFKWTWLTGGSNGLSGVPRLDLLGFDLSGGAGANYYYLSLLGFACSLWLLWVIVRSPLGRTFVGIRENEGRMRAIGYNTVLYKLSAFVIAGLFAGFAGALYIGFNRSITPGEVSWAQSGQVMIMVIIGGAGTLVGPVLGAALELLLKNWVSSLPMIGERWQIIMGLIFVGFVLFARRGMLGIFEDAMRRTGRAPGRAVKPVAASSESSA